MVNESFFFSPTQNLGPLAQLILEGEILREELLLCEEELAEFLPHPTNATEPIPPPHAAGIRIRKATRFRLIVEEENGTHASETNHTTTGEEGHGENSSQKLRDLELAETILHWISVSILALFTLELAMMLLIFGKYFFMHILYVIDFVVVSISLGLEVGFYGRPELQDVVGVLIFIRLWRLVRAGHGIMSIQAEKQGEKIHKLIVKNALLNSDVAEYRMETMAYERLLDQHGIRHPKFSETSDKFHHGPALANEILEPEQEALVGRWLQQAERQNLERIESWFVHKHTVPLELHKSAFSRNRLKSGGGGGPEDDGDDDADDAEADNNNNQ